MLLRGRDDITISPHAALTWLGLFTSRACNLRCLYCYEGSGRSDPDELTEAERLNILEQAKELGARVLVIPGAGEPLTDAALFSMINKAHSLEMTTLLYTNATLIDREAARFFFARDVTVLVKLESLDAKIHNYLTGKDWSHQKAMQGLEQLLAAGYGDTNGNPSRIGIAALYTKLNLHQLQNLQRWCVGHKLSFMVDWLSISQRAVAHEEELKPSRQEIQQCAEQMLGIRETGCDCEKGQCILWHHGINIDQQGFARPCTEVRTKDIGNCRKYDLASLIQRKNKMFTPRGGKWTCFFKDRYYE